MDFHEKASVWALRRCIVEGLCERRGRRRRTTSEQLFVSAP
jgi:hypothetical protein